MRPSRWVAIGGRLRGSGPRLDGGRRLRPRRRLDRRWLAALPPLLGVIAALAVLAGGGEEDPLAGGSRPSGAGGSAPGGTATAPAGAVAPLADPAPASRRLVVEREVEYKEVVVGEREVEHPHRADFDLSLLAVAALVGLSGAVLSRRKVAPPKLAPAVTPLALAAALALTVAAIDVSESPERPRTVAVRSSNLRPAPVPIGIERIDEGRTVRVVRRFRREVPVRRLEHVHAWVLAMSWQLPLLVLSAAWAVALGAIGLRPSQERPAHRADITTGGIAR